MKKLLFFALLTLGLQSFACENVELTFLFNPSVAPGVITYTLENENGGVETYNVEINPNGYGTADLCLPNSCFELGFVYNIIQPADIYSVTYTTNSATSIWTPNFSENGAIENPLTICVESQACFLDADVITAVCGQATIVVTSNAPDQAYTYYIDGEFYTSGESVVVLANLMAGEHTYCVTSTADICDNEEVCGSFMIQNCSCPTGLEVNMLNDCLAIFHPIEFEPEAFVLYYVDGVQVSNGEAIFTYQFAGSGEFEVCMESCEEMYCEIFTVEGCLEDCPTETYAAGDGCVWQFEIGSFSPGESVIWNFGDGTESVVGGHYIQHEYFAAGDYVVTANYTSNACPNGTTFTFIATADGCPSECNPYMEVANNDCSYTFSLIPESGWVDQVYWTVNNVTYVGSSTMTFDLSDAGAYVVCAESFNGICEQGFSICTTVESTGCAADCTPYLFHLIAPVEPGAIQIINWQIADENGVVESGVQTFLNDNPTFIQDFCLPDGCYSIIIQSTSPIANVQAWMSNANGEVPWSSAMWDSMSAFLQFGVNADCNETPECTLEVEYYQTENGNNIFTAFPSDDDAVVDWFLDGEYYETGNVVDGSFEAGIHEMCAMYETPNCPEGVTQCLSFVILGLPECTEVLISIDPQGIPGLDLDFDFELESVIDQIVWEFDGAFTIYEECDGTFIGICLPDGCYTLSMSMDEFLQFGILINILVEGGLDVNYVIDPLTQTVGLEFGVNNNCENNVVGFDYQKIIAYPVPAQGILFLAENTTDVNWKIFDLSGRMVLSGNNVFGNKVIDAQVLSVGNYLLQLQSSDATTIQKIQIIK